MAPVVIDLTTSVSEDDTRETPRKNVLAGFQPRKDKQKTEKGINGAPDVDNEVRVSAAKERNTTHQQSPVRQGNAAKLGQKLLNSLSDVFTSHNNQQGNDTTSQSNSSHPPRNGETSTSVLQQPGLKKTAVKADQYPGHERRLRLEEFALTKSKTASPNGVPMNSLASKAEANGRVSLHAEAKGIQGDHSDAAPASSIKGWKNYEPKVHANGHVKRASYTSVLSDSNRNSRDDMSMAVVETHVKPYQSGSESSQPLRPTLANSDSRDKIPTAAVETHPKRLRSDSETLQPQKRSRTAVSSTEEDYSRALANFLDRRASTSARAAALSIDDERTKRAAGAPARQTGSFIKPERPSDLPSSQTATTTTATGQPTRLDLSGGPYMNGLPYTAEEDALLKWLKEVDRLPWNQITPRFNGRTFASLQTHYSNKLLRLPRQVGTTTASAPAQASASGSSRRNSQRPSLPYPSQPPAQRMEVVSDAPARPKLVKGSGPAVTDGFVSWASLKGSAKANDQFEATKSASADNSAVEDAATQHFQSQDRTFPLTMSRFLRHRELGITTTSAWGSGSRGTTEELQNHVFKDYRLRGQHEKMSGDVISLNWSPDGRRFGAAAIAISDQRSMQYNMSRNLLFGDASAGEVRELTEHHVPRPVIQDASNVNMLHAMRESQDPRLFLTVTATGFSVDGSKLFTTGTDKRLRQYRLREDGTPRCRNSVEHDASVDLLAVHGHTDGLLAVGCHSSSRSIRLYESRQETRAVQILSPSRSTMQSSVAIFPSALKWGVTHQHSNLLLAGFSSDEDKANAGETLLYDARSQTSYTLAGTRNVFDVAWNPLASTASISFVVASDPSSESVSRGTRSIVQCFAPDQGRARRVLTWQCPAIDINDVVICPYDDNLIAAGATDGCVYIWDQRSADRSQQPLHVLRHGASENVLADDRDRELADTGVRFLSWGATKSRLYTGSSDGIVKVWNPYRSADNAHLQDIVAPSQQRSAVMSGAFSPDYRELLIGTENGRIDLLALGVKRTAKAKPFSLIQPPPVLKKVDQPFEPARSLIRSGQIELKPCGAMPLRQAVQGPNYESPVLKAFAVDAVQTEQAYQQARDEQARAHEEDQSQEQKLKADRKVEEAERAIDDLQERERHFAESQPKAEELQRTMFKLKKERQELERLLTYPADQCDLGCAVLPQPDEEPEDSGRSDLRIPDMLRSIEQLSIRSKEEGVAAGCGMCFPAYALRARAKGKKVKYCASCTLKKARLTSVCNRCSGPARLQTDQKLETLCEQCSFTCFRCGQAGEHVVICPGLTHLTCFLCDLVWEAGALGYELLTDQRKSGKGKAGSLTIDEYQEEELGTEEREHYASLWQDPDPAWGY